MGKLAKRCGYLRCMKKHSAIGFLGASYCLLLIVLTALLGEVVSMDNIQSLSWAQLLIVSLVGLAVTHLATISLKSKI